LLLVSLLYLAYRDSENQLVRNYLKVDSLPEKILQNYENDLEKITKTEWTRKIKKMKVSVDGVHNNLDMIVKLKDTKNYGEEGTIKLKSTINTKKSELITSYIILESKNDKQCYSFDDPLSQVDIKSTNFMLDVTSDTRINLLEGKVRKKYDEQNQNIEFSWQPFLEECSKYGEISLPTFLRYLDKYQHHPFKHVLLRGAGDKATIAGYIITYDKRGLKDKTPFIEDYTYSMEKGWVVPSSKQTKSGLTDFLNSIFK
jgi:hypothetical protein